MHINRVMLEFHGPLRIHFSLSSVPSPLPIPRMQILPNSIFGARPTERDAFHRAAVTREVQCTLFATAQFISSAIRQITIPTKILGQSLAEKSLANSNALTITPLPILSNWLGILEASFPGEVHAFTITFKVRRIATHRSNSSTICLDIASALHDIQWMSESH